MVEPQVFSLDRLDRFEVKAKVAEPVLPQERQALRLEDGLAILKEMAVGDSVLEVDIWCTGPAYPGLVFRAQGSSDFELVYMQPHTSGQWDAIQYDPVFHGSNNWQNYSGPAYQGVAEVPLGIWLTLRAEVRGGELAAWVWPAARPLPAGAPPQLTVARLAHGVGSGQIGVWTYRPAYFSDLRVGPLGARPAGKVATVEAAPGLITDWLLEGHGAVAAEESGVLNLNRFLSPAGQTEAVLSREIVVSPAGEVLLSFGFSDELQLLVDDEIVFEGSCRFTGFADRAARGYVELGAHLLRLTLSPGSHRLTARLRVCEPFGWGLAMQVIMR